MNNFTENQKRAVTQRGNVIVSAGAGSGKTTVMIARIIEKLKSGSADLENMLIVTFTRASAADMRSKLSDELYKLRSDKKYAAVAERAAERMASCNIGTLHSYCQKLIKSYFYAAGIDPSAAVCEESEAAAVKRAAVSAAVDRAWNDGDPYFSAMYDMLCTRRSDDGIKDVVSDILDFALSMPDPHGYLSGTKPDRHYFDALDATIAEKRRVFGEKTEALKRDLEAAQMHRHVLALSEFCGYADGKTDALTPTSHRTRLDMTDVLNERFKALKAECVKLRGFISECSAAKNTDSENYSRALCAAAADAYERYTAGKERSGKIDYSDLEHGAYRVLCDGECLKEIMQTVRYVFIDEFQDVNPLQSAIADKFRSAGAEMFVVGDVKQSIYGFRRCSPEHFINAVGDGSYTHIALADNFRSAEPIVDFINKVFDGVMTKDFGGVDYCDSSQRLVYGNKNITGGAAEFVLSAAEEQTEHVGSDSVLPDPLTRTDKEFTGYSVAADSNTVATSDPEAKLVADRIVEYIRSGSAPEMSGIAVLLRSAHGPFCKALTSELDERGIRYTFERKNSVRSFPEAVALTDILRCADDRFDDVALYTAMRSPMGGFSDAELAEIAVCGEQRAVENNVFPMSGSDRKKYAFWQKITAYDGRLSDKIQKFISFRNDVAELAKTRDCADVLGYITSRTEYFQYVYETGGNARAVEALIDRAAERRCDAHAFLEYLDNIGFDLDADVGGDAVTITTVHASKGLEYDYVIVADTAHKFNESDRYGRAIISEHGVFVKIPDAGTGTLVKSAPWIAESMRIPDRTRAEELRLFYVALTRAKRKLTVCGKDKNFKHVEPRDAVRALDFMRNVKPDYADKDGIPPGVAQSRTVPYIDERIYAAVRAEHDFTADYNARREKNDIPIKTCVTAVSSELIGDGEYHVNYHVLTDDDRSEGGIGAMARGTAYHRAMELVDFDEPDIKKLETECEDFGRVDAAEILAAAAEMNRLVRGAVFVAKERYFMTDMPANEIYGSELPSDVGILVQGVIDLLIVYGNGDAVIVDYKTGDPHSMEDPKYGMQLKLYAAAVEKCTPYKVKRAYLYSFAARRLVDRTDAIGG